MMPLQPSQEAISSFRWLGSHDKYLDTPTIPFHKRLVVGCYGGCTHAGADKNEDGAIVWYAEDNSWEFATLLDGHSSSESVELVVMVLETHAISIIEILSQPIETMFSALHQYLLSIFQSPSFRTQCQQVRGETACLISVRKAQFLWWFSVGDCLVYLLHPELAHMKQFLLNQRSFFEWIGHANTFDLPVPCYSTGIRELRSGQNRIVMMTDGLIECGSRPFEKPQHVYDMFMQDQKGKDTMLQNRVFTALQRVHQEQGRDSATLIAWDYENMTDTTFPSQ